ncbi:SRPBCC family protein [Williamsia deligens]|uniref:SRPBCC family protein n=1 Tax=Williamsia deligens TaxID=321325 RepID=A0ABW3G349_9NOCA|nr:SRPBCC family protein [Williamsia deligens]MCP2194148.1 Polyketide cyclase / dehydrase and lipid transport [Williamsia deligens]
MRVRDLPTVEVSARLTISVDAAWASVTDITLPTRVPGELSSVEWEDGHDGVALGARFIGHNRSDDLGEWSTSCVVVDLEPGRRWVYAVFGLWDEPDPSPVRPAPGPEPMTWWGFEVEPASTGCIVRQFARMGPGPSGISAAVAAHPDREARIIDRRLGVWREAMGANLAALG